MPPRIPAIYEGLPGDPENRVPEAGSMVTTRQQVEDFGEAGTIQREEDEETRSFLAERSGSDPEDVTDTLTQAVQMLVDNGADPNAVAQYLNVGVPGSSNIAELIVRNPSLTEFWVQRFPATGMSQYSAAETDFGFAQQLAGVQTNFRYAADVASGTTSLPEMEGSRAGKNARRTPDGIIVVTDESDPTATPTVLYPGDAKGRLPGSPQWLAKTEGWDDKTVKRWRKRLSNLGYNIAPEGGYAQDLKNALAVAYKDFYANGEKWVQAAPVEGLEDDRVRVRDVFDRDVAKRLAVTGMRQAWGAEPSDGEVEVWTGHLLDLAKHLIRKGYEPSQAAESAAARFDTSLEETPIAQANRQWEDEWGDDETGLHAALLASAQVADQMGSGF